MLKQPKFHWNFGIILHRVNHEYSTNILKPKLHPLEASAKSGQAEIVKSLFERVYYPYIKPKYFPFYKGILKKLMGKNEKVQTFKAFKDFLKKFLQQDIIDDDLLNTAYKKDSKEIKKILQLLLNIPNSMGNTPMHSYAYHGNMKQSIEIVKFAAPICLSPNHQDNFGATPKHIALEKGHLEIVKALIPKWDNRKAKNHENKTAFQIAKEKGHKEIMKLMIENTLE